MTELPSRARVVIVGGGIIGCSVAYHLAKLGWTDVLLLEQGHLSGGTTWHAAGLVGPLRATESGTRLVQYSAELYAALEAETGMATGYRSVGGVVVARTEDRMVQLRRTAANAVAYDMECELSSPGAGPGAVAADAGRRPARGSLAARRREGEPDRRHPVAGQGRPDARRHDRGEGAGPRRRRRGAGARPRVTGVRTDQGRQRIETEIVVNCAGQWAKALGDQVGVTVPLHSAEHFYVVTEAVEGTHPDLPIMRDPDGWTYFKEEVGGLVVGGFEPDAKPWRSPDDLPHPFEFQLLEEDWEHFSVLMDEALVRVPAWPRRGSASSTTGRSRSPPTTSSCSGRPPELDGYYVGAGFNSVGIASAGGAGRALAEWIVAGEPTMDLVGVDVRRFAPFHGDNAWLRSRVAEVLGLHYAIPWPNREVESGRPQRVSPLHDTLAAAGAVFGTKMGWERPNVFHPRRPRVLLGQAVVAGRPRQRSNGPPAPRLRSSTRRRSASTSSAGRAPSAALQWICAADVDVPVGCCVYTPFLNARATYEADLTVTRTGEDEFLIVSSSATTVRDLDWLRRQTPAGLDVELRDITDEHAVLGVMGPASRDLVTGLGAEEMGEEDFPFATSREISWLAWPCARPG